MLERKRLLRPRGRSADGARIVYEHMRLKRFIELPAEELTPDFFVQVQEQLSVLVARRNEAGPAPELPAGWA